MLFEQKYTKYFYCNECQFYYNECLIFAHGDKWTLVYNLFGFIWFSTQKTILWNILTLVSVQQFDESWISHLPSQFCLLN